MTSPLDPTRAQLVAALAEVTAACARCAAVLDEANRRLDDRAWLHRRLNALRAGDGLPPLGACEHEPVREPA